MKHARITCPTPAAARRLLAAIRAQLPPGARSAAALAGHGRAVILRRPLTPST